MNQHDKPLIMQSGRNDCALACIAMIANWYYIPRSIEDLRMVYKNDNAPVSVSTISLIANSIGLGLTAFSCNVDEISRIPQPFMAHWNNNHYVVIWETKPLNSKIIFTISDPARGRQNLKERELKSYFSGVVIRIVPRIEIGAAI